ncbi:hypothetical protein COLO4_04723 [Corchorus olitorius]|uniref:DUF4216 domain-containing protein n=1 Tax=Corchorus olitorius TaxID=93759 RepID=A0A1R3KSZ8_9ROSI|nr:hypothetical protein COLO4_04723 [Corchorus olitorius]
MQERISKFFVIEMILRLKMTLLVPKATEENNKNKSAVEGSICETYIAYEINTFSQHYFELDVRCTSRRPRKNDEVVNDLSKPPFSIFNYPGRFHGRPRVRLLNPEERKVAHTYVLRNCPEVDPYLEMFVDYLKHEGHSSDEIDQGIEMFFADWFKLYVQTRENAVTDPLLQDLAWGPSNKATSWPAYMVNGYNFHTFVHGQGRATINSGICVCGSDSNDPSHDFYGDWFDPINGMKVHPLYKLVDVNRKKFYKKYDPFILAQQAIQVYYCHYPSMKKDKVDWMAVCETKSRRVVDSASKEESDQDATAYQVDDIPHAPSVSISEQIPSLFDQLQGLTLEVDLGILPQSVPSELPTDEEEFESEETSDDEDDVDPSNDY